MLAKTALKKFDREHPIHSAPYFYRQYADIVWCEENGIKYELSYNTAMKIHKFTSTVSGVRAGYDHSCLDCRKSLVKFWLKYITYGTEKG